MPKPANPEQLLHPQAGLPAGWADEFGPYHWSYVAGFSAACAALRVKNNLPGRSLFNRFRDRAVRAVPEAWKALFVDPNHKTDGWGSFSSQQLQRAFKEEPMRLDKAVITIFLLDLVAQELNSDVDVWEIVSIKPAIFHISRYDITFFDREVHGHLADQRFREGILRATFQRTTAIFDFIAKKQTITYGTAELTLQFLTTNLTPPPLIGPVAPILERTEIPGSKKPCLLETVQ